MCCKCDAPHVTLTEVSSLGGEEGTKLSLYLTTEGRRMATFWKRELGALMSTIDKSSLFHKYSSLLFEILLNNFEQNLQSGQLYHWATTNGAEITTSLFAVIHSSHGTFEGLSALLRECASISKYYAEHNMSLTQNVVNSTTITWGLYVQIISLSKVALDIKFLATARFYTQSQNTCRTESPKHFLTSRSQAKL